MKRITSALLAVLVVLGTVGAFPVAAAQTDTQEDEQTDMRAGDRLSAVIGVQQAEFDGEIDSRAFGLEIAAAASADAKAQIVAERLEQNRQRLADLEERKQQLQQARDSGNISEGEYQARATALAAQSANVKRAAAESDAAADTLPATVLQENGVNVTAILTLKNQASKLTGPEVAKIARTIAGPGVGDQQRGEDQPSNATEAIARAEQHVQEAQERLQQTEKRVNSTNASENATAALALAREQLAVAEQALELAKQAQDDGDTNRAAELAEQASEYASDVTERAEEAQDAAHENGSERGGDHSGDEGTDGASSGEETTTSDGSTDRGSSTSSDDQQY